MTESGRFSFGIDDAVRALALPDRSRVDQRILKKMQERFQL
jgi:hypothetical protein